MSARHSQEGKLCFAMRAAQRPQKGPWAQASLWVDRFGTCATCTAPAAPQGRHWPAGSTGRIASWGISSGASASAAPALAS
eukprot:10100772-Alexandrium_andersonii.AAC.1